MTRENYRTQMRAVFLAAIMVVSMVGMSVAFAGGAAAQTTGTDVAEYTPDNPWQGQDVTANATDMQGEEDYTLRVVDDYDDGTVDEHTFVEELVSEDNGDVIIETDDLEAGEDYFLVGPGLVSAGDVPRDEVFEVRNQQLDVDFDDDEVTDSGDSAETEIEVDTNRGSSDLVVNAEGDLDEDELYGIFNATPGAFALTQDLTPDEEDDLDDDYDLDPDEAIKLLGVSDDDYDIAFNEIDADDYEFNFDVSDTEATASDSITVRERDTDADFSEGTYEAGAGDIAEFEFEVDDTDEVWIQIGDENSDFVDVLYVEVDDEDEEVEVMVNTRLLGTSMSDLDGEDVYDVSNDDDMESAYHDANGGAMSNTPASGTVFEDDGTQSDALDFYVDELGVADSAFEQLTRPLQATDYELQLAGDDIDGDEGVFDADSGAGEANDQLDSAVLELTVADIGDIVTHTAPEEDADDEDDVSELLDIVTQRDEIAIEDRLVVQVEATGLYGSLIAGADGADADDVDFDRLDDGLSTTTAADAFDTENIELEIEADQRTGNQDPLAVDLGADDSETYMLIGPDQDQFFLVVDTSDDDAFDNGDAPDATETFTATLEYDADNDDERYTFAGTKEPFSNGADANNYPYLLQGDVVETSTEFDLEPRAISFENLNADDEVQAENIEDSEIIGETNVAPGSDAELRASSTAASSSFRIGETVDISEDGELSAEYDFSGQEPGDEFDTRFRVEGSTVDTVSSVIVAEGDLGLEDPAEDDEDDVVDDDDDVVDDDDDVVDDDDDVVDDDDVEEPTDDETPGFGALVALVALIGAALLAARRQN